MVAPEWQIHEIVVTRSSITGRSSPWKYSPFVFPIYSVCHISYFHTHFDCLLICDRNYWLEQMPKNVKKKFDARVAYGIESMVPPNVAWTEKNEQMTQRNEFWFNFGLFFMHLFLLLYNHTLYHDLITSNPCIHSVKWYNASKAANLAKSLLAGAECQNMLFVCSGFYLF